MHYLKTTEASLIRLHERVNNNEVICHNQNKGNKILCPSSGSHRKVKQNDKIRPVQDSGSLAVFKVTARDQVIIRDLRGHLLHTVTFLVPLCILTHEKKKEKNIYTLFKRKKNTGTARASNGLDMLTWCSFHIYVYCT